jgi:hypothetical protein
MSDQSSNRPLAGKAVTYKALGGPEVIEIVERTVRAPAAGEVRIEVKAAAVNPTDILFRDPGFGDQFGGDTFPSCPAWMPQVSSNLSGRAYLAYMLARR